MFSVMCNVWVVWAIYEQEPLLIINNGESLVLVSSYLGSDLMCDHGYFVSLFKIG